MKEAVCIVNPDAGGGTEAADLAPALRVLRAGGIRVHVREKGPAKPAAIARQAIKDGIDLVIVAGGDGTVAKVGKQLVGTDAVLGILPFGTYMNIARSLGIPLGDATAAARLIARGRPRSIDLAELNGGLFFEAAGIGAGADIFRVVEAADRRRTASAIVAFEALLRRRPVRMTVEVDGRRHEHRALHVLVANLPYYGWGLRPLRRVVPDDGLLDVAVYEERDWLGLRDLFAPGGSGPEASAHRYRGAEIVVRARAPAHADGGAVGAGPFRFRSLPKALRVLAGRRIVR